MLVIANALILHAINVRNKEAARDQIEARSSLESRDESLIAVDLKRAGVKGLQEILDRIERLEAGLELPRESKAGE